MILNKLIIHSWVEEDGADFLTRKYVAMYGNIFMSENTILLVDLIDEYIIYHI